jgi:hypothetical protein
MFVLNSEFQIGKYKWKGCNNVSIKKSIHEYADTAIIKLPASVVMKTNAEYVSVQTHKQFKVGDNVKIRLGYNGKLNDEFVGFVKRVNFKMPCEIECEGYSWILRNRKNLKKSWSETTLKEVLEFLIKDTVIKLHPDIPDMPLKNIVLDNASGTEVIEHIKSLLKGVLTCFFMDDTLYMGLAYMDLAKASVKHKLGWNTIGEDDLKYREAADVKVKIEIEHRKTDGTQIVVSSGAEGGVVRREKVSTVTDAAKLEEIAKAKLLQESYDGYEGTFTTFLLPFVQPGYKDIVTDPRYNERQGNYFVESVETTFGTGGGRRKIQIGIKLNS